MTITELIAQLSRLPGEWPVYVRGYEAGVEDAEKILPGFFVRDYHDPEETWIGRHQMKYDGDSNGVQIVGEPRSPR